MPDLVETVLTCQEDRVYLTFDDAVTITGNVATVPTGWDEMAENSSWSLEGTGATADGQIRSDRGHAKPVVVNKSHTVTFALKPQVDTDPVQTHLIDLGKIMRLLKVGEDGFYVSVLCQVTRVRESSTLGGLPAWEGTAEVRAHPVRGKITTWPPVPAP